MFKQKRCTGSATSSRTFQHHSSSSRVHEVWKTRWHSIRPPIYIGRAQKQILVGSVYANEPPHSIRGWFPGAYRYHRSPPRPDVLEASSDTAFTVVSKHGDDAGKAHSGVLCKWTEWGFPDHGCRSTGLSYAFSCPLWTLRDGFLSRRRGIYGRKFPPQQIPHQHLTHINYAFASVNGSGEVALSDSWADVEVSNANL
jgi:hypothetical protein